MQFIWHNMKNSERFLQKHCRPVNEMTMREIESLYRCLPTLVTLFVNPPHIDNFTKFDNVKSNDCYMSLKRVGLYIINLRTKKINNIFAKVAVCFEKDMEEYYPVHVFRINFDTSLHIYSRPLPKSFFEK